MTTDVKIRLMSANLENAIQDKVHRLSDDQQRQVMAFVERLKPGMSDGALSAIGLLDSFAKERGFKSADEVDAYLREERDSWDR